MIKGCMKTVLLFKFLLIIKRIQRIPLPIDNLSQNKIHLVLEILLSISMPVVILYPKIVNMRINQQELMKIKAIMELITHSLIYKTSMLLMDRLKESVLIVLEISLAKIRFQTQYRKNRFKNNNNTCL